MPREGNSSQSASDSFMSQAADPGLGGYRKKVTNSVKNAHNLLRTWACGVRSGLAIAKQKSVGALATDPFICRLRHGVTNVRLEKEVLHIAVR